MAISDVSVAWLDETASLLAGRGADAQHSELDVSDRVVVKEYAAVIAEHFGVVHAPALQQRRGRFIAVGGDRSRVPAAGGSSYRACALRASAWAGEALAEEIATLERHAG